MFSLEGKLALVTGSSRGLGYSMARGLADAGAAVVLNGRDETRLAEAKASLDDGKRTLHAKAFDATDSAAVEAAIEDIEKNIGPIEILFNNAGIIKRAPMVDMPESDWRAVIDANLTGPFLVGRTVARYMIERRRGKIVNTCSLTSEEARNTVSPYAASKAGLKLLTQSMATEWAQYNIQVNGIGPGFFATELTVPLQEDPEFDGWIKTRTPAARWGDPDELIGPAVFLASEGSSFVNGHVLYVDGGFLATM